MKGEKTMTLLTILRSAAVPLALLCGVAQVQAQAQAVYRIIGADGRVTFSDKPPAAGQSSSAAPLENRSAAEAARINALPFELRQAASRYPVTLYTTDSCEPCDAGRALLLRRGIPFAERTVTTPQDGEALKRLSGNSSALPFLMIGAQGLRGFSDVEWSQFLNAAGYPAQSQLPPGYRPAPPMPLVSSQPPVLPPVAPPPGTSAPAPASNPAGIVF
jgi:glutaredoxin